MVSATRVDWGGMQGPPCILNAVNTPNSSLGFNTSNMPDMMASLCIHYHFIWISTFDVHSSLLWRMQLPHFIDEDIKSSRYRAANMTQLSYSHHSLTSMLLSTLWSLLFYDWYQLAVYSLHLVLVETAFRGDLQTCDELFLQSRTRMQVFGWSGPATEAHAVLSAGCSSVPVLPSPLGFR